MTEKEIFNTIIQIPKWYAGIPVGGGRSIDAHYAGQIKRRFEAGGLSEKLIERIFNYHGYFKSVVWERK